MALFQRGTNASRAEHKDTQARFEDNFFLLCAYSTPQQRARPTGIK